MKYIILLISLILLSSCGTMIEVRPEPVYVHRYYHYIPQKHIYVRPYTPYYHHRPYYYR